MLAIANPLIAVDAVVAARRAARSGNESAARRARIAATIAVGVALVVAGFGALQWYAMFSAPSRLEANVDAQQAETKREVESVIGPIPKDSDPVSPDEITRIENDLDHDRISDRAVSAREVKVFAALRDAANAHRITDGQLRVVESLIRSARADHMVDPDEATHILNACDAILAAPAPKPTAR